MYEEGAKLIPAVREAPFRAAWSAARPLIGSRDEADSGRELSRTFKTIDHAETDGSRASSRSRAARAPPCAGMAELCADVVCRKLGVDAPCRTRDTVLLPHIALLRRMSAAGSAIDTPLPRVPVQARRRVAALRRVRRARDESSPRSSRDFAGSRCTATRSLGLRHSCFHASCGTCGVRVNGREGLACVTQLSAIRRHGDGRTDREPAGARTTSSSTWRRSPTASSPPHPIVRSSEFLEEAEPPDGIERHERFEDCIECGLCLSACPVAATDDTYVGPAALAYAQRMLEERERCRPAKRSWTGPTETRAAWRCHAAFECTEACPSDVRPAQRIMAPAPRAPGTQGGI